MSVFSTASDPSAPLTEKSNPMLPAAPLVPLPDLLDAVRKLTPLPAVHQNPTHHCAISHADKQVIWDDLLEDEKLAIAYTGHSGDSVMSKTGGEIIPEKAIRSMLLARLQRGPVKGANGQNIYINPSPRLIDEIMQVDEPMDGSLFFSADEDTECVLHTAEKIFRLDIGEFVPCDGAGNYGTENAPDFDPRETYPKVILGIFDSTLDDQECDWDVFQEVIGTLLPYSRKPSKIVVLSGPRKSVDVGIAVIETAIGKDDVLRTTPWDLCCNLPSNHPRVLVVDIANHWAPEAAKNIASTLEKSNGWNPQVILVADDYTTVPSASIALAFSVVHVHFRESPMRPNKSLMARIESERSKLILWAAIGWRRRQANNGAYSLSRAAHNRLIRALGTNPLVQFLAERVKTAAPRSWVYEENLRKTYADWLSRRNEAGDLEAMDTDLHALGVTKSSHVIGGVEIPTYVGISLDH